MRKDGWRMDMDKIIRAGGNVSAGKRRTGDSVPSEEKDSR